MKSSKDLSLRGEILQNSNDASLSDAMVQNSNDVSLSDAIVQNSNDVSLLNDILRKFPRRYQINCGLTPFVAAIEAAREAVEQGGPPTAAVRHRFLEALAQLIRSAMHPEQGDPAFQAMVLAHREAVVREYVSLSAQAAQDRRVVIAAVNAVAHPAKLKRVASARLVEVLSELYQAAASSSWAKLHAAAQRISKNSEIWREAVPDKAMLEDGIAHIRDNAALARLKRIETLELDSLVQQYQSLHAQNGPRLGSTGAAAQGAASKKRGARVEALAAHALQGIADRLNQIEGSPNTYRVATSLHVPVALMGDAQRSKAEWDVMLLRQATSSKAPEVNISNADAPSINMPTPPAFKTADQIRSADTAESDPCAPIWHLCLLVEVKASADAATTDFPRLLRGLKLLAQADRDTVYAFTSKQGTVRISGASLNDALHASNTSPNVLNMDEVDLKSRVLYCTDEPPDVAPRLLNPAARMQFLSAPASLEFASQPETAHLAGLEPVWQALVESPRWRPVLNQYQTLRQVRELIVHVDDLK